MKIIFLMVLSMFFLRADEALIELFQQLNKTPKEQRYKIVNEIKTHIIQLKTKERVEAIKIFQKEKKLHKEVPKTCITAVASEHKEPSTHKMSIDKKMPMEISSHMHNMSKMENMLQMPEMREQQNMPTPMRPNEPNTPSSPRNHMPTPK